jgi:MFS family permease
MGLGPCITGILSDYLAPEYGSNSIRWSLLIVGMLDLLAALFFYLAARVVKEDVVLDRK